MKGCPFLEVNTDVVGVKRRMNHIQPHMMVAVVTKSNQTQLRQRYKYQRDT